MKGIFNIIIKYFKYLFYQNILFLFEKVIVQYLKKEGDIYGYIFKDGLGSKFY